MGKSRKSARVSEVPVTAGMMMPGMGMNPLASMMNPFMMQQQQMQQMQQMQQQQQAMAAGGGESRQSANERQSANDSSSSESSDEEVKRIHKEYKKTPLIYENYRKKAVFGSNHMRTKSIFSPLVLRQHMSLFEQYWVLTFN